MSIERHLHFWIDQINLGKLFFLQILVTENHILFQSGYLKSKLFIS